MATKMRVARLHEPGKPLRIDQVDVPEPRPDDVLVQVKASGVIPNMNAIFSGKLWNVLPPLPASVGLDAAGVVVKIGSEVRNVGVGDHVFVNAGLACGNCPYCQSGVPLQCTAGAFQGYFGFRPESVALMRKYPYGGFSEYMTASPDRLVKLPQEVSFEQAARFGYLGTSFAGLRLGKVGGGSWIAINGITGTLGVGATLLALGMGATRILGFGRNRELLVQVKALSPARIDTLALGERPIRDWIVERTEGLGVDMLLDCSGRPAPASATGEALRAVKRGGVGVNIGALTEPLTIEPFRFMTDALQFIGSTWFSTAEGRMMAEMARVGVLDLGKLVTRAYPLEDVNVALEEAKKRPGGFVNIVVNPDK